jgi:hypothetical protein
MNDTELDEILDTWTAPPPPTALRGNVAHAHMRAVSRRVSTPRLGMTVMRKILLAGLILGILGFLLAVTQAFPRPAVRIPYTVDSEFIRYADDGSSSIEMYTKSYQRNGAEMIESRSMPGHPFGTALGRALDTTLPLWSRLMTSLTVDDGTIERLRRHIPHTTGAVTGCGPSCLLLQHYFFARAAAGVDTGCLDGAIITRETILNYATTAVQLPLGENARMTWWTAPDLGCFALRITTEGKRRDGTFRLLTEKRALRVNLNQ